MPGNEEEVVVEMRSASFGYGARQVLSPTSIAIDAGTLTFIIGPNGAGKTTLLRLVAGLTAPATGTVRCFGLDPFAADRHTVARRLAFLPQSYELTFPFKVAEVVLLGRYAHGRRGLAGFYTREDDRARAAEAMERCDVTPLADRQWNQLSGGEQRRALLAQAFCQDSDLLLLDEPTASLDPAHAIDIFEAIRSGGPTTTTTIVVTHDLNLAARYGDRLLLLSEGELVADGEPAAVLSGPSASRAFGVELHVGTIPDTQTHFVVPR